jgi:vacuolar-type H+-ATPase subunit E/Vma4
MDASGLLSALETTTRGQAEALLHAAAGKAAAILEEGARRRELARARARGEADAAFSAVLDDALRSARQQAAAEALEARRQFLDDLLRRAGALLEAAIASKVYQDGLEEHLADALGYAGPSEDAVVRCAPALLEPLRRLAGRRARVEADEQIRDGFEVISGNLRVDARLSTELRRRWPEISVALGRLA